MKKLVVGLGARAYPITIEYGCLTGIGEILARESIGNRYCIITDSTVASLYGGTVQQSLARSGLKSEILVFPAGEASKNLATFTTICRKMAELRFDRRDAIIALGGGVAGDLAGFAAASYMRGIPFVQVPTTLLAQVDSSVGGKTGVDIPEGKNLVGAFYQPRAVFIDPGVLSTLDSEEFLGGMAEVIKYGMIRDADFFLYLQDNREKVLQLQPAALMDILFTCCKIKADIVALDEREAGLRRILNYGHTIGHAVEAASNFTLIHGKAVAMGMVAAGRIAVNKNMLAPEVLDTLIWLLQAYDLPVEIPQELSKDQLKEYILADKKVVSGKVPYILPEKIGEVVVCDDVYADDVDLALSSLKFGKIVGKIN